MTPSQEELQNAYDNDYTVKECYEIANEERDKMKPNTSNNKHECINCILNVLTGAFLMLFMLLDHNTEKFDVFFLVFFLGALTLIYGLFGLFMEFRTYK